MFFLRRPVFQSHPPRFQPRTSGHAALTVVLALSAGSGLALAGSFWWTRAGAPGPRATEPPVGDTTMVYGPRTFDTPTGSAAHHLEGFAVALTPGRRYTLRVVNGAPDGSGRVSGGAVVLNGWEVLSSAEMGAGGPEWRRVVQARTADTLHVTVEGVAGAYVTVSLEATADASFLVFGVERFTRTSGTPVTENRQFSIGPTAAPPYRLCIANGNDDGTQRISSASIVLNGSEVVTQNEFGQQVASLSKEVSLQQGNNTLSVTLAAQPSGFLDLCITATDTTPPVLTVAAPAPGLITRDTTVLVSGTVQDETATEVTVNGVAASRNGDAYEATVALPAEGENLITVSATDGAGLTTDSTRTVIRDTQPPVLTVTAPTNGLITNQTSVSVSGSVFDATAVTVNANGVPLPVDGAGQFTGSVALNEGANVITVTATDAADNQSPEVRLVTRDTQPPVLTVSEPGDGATTSEETIVVSGTVQDLTAVVVTVNGQPVTVAPDGSFSGNVPLAVGPNTLTVTATDAATNSSMVTRSVIRAGGGLPPDPASVAPPLDQAVATTTFAATQFLYTGANPIQTGVAPGTIDPVRVAVLRGRVLDRDNAPIPGVTVSILGHAEFGQTLTRVDGRFDLALNGGGALTISYEKTGWLPVRRTVDVPWQDYLPVDDVAMVSLDPAVTVVNLSQPAQVHRATPQTDADGTRQATLLFDQGTTAELVMSDGTTQPLASLSVRATEYTVGPNGPKAMPAELPPASVYTYAVELSADEAVTAGAHEVRFSQPVAFYVDNFLGLPVGARVPVASYDRARAVWVPIRDGRIIGVLDTTGGVATVDITGDGVADGPDSLTPLGMDGAELARLAELYAPGAELWRASVEHFSPFDLNFPVDGGEQLPETGEPEVGGGGGGGPDDAGKYQKPDDPCETGGSIIECQTQVLGERIGVVGTPFTLNYRSDRVPGRVADRRVRVPLTGDSVPEGLELIRYQFLIAGRAITDSVPAAPNQTVEFVWDGKDAYGREVQGFQPMTIRIGYAFYGEYREPAPADPSFGLVGGITVYGTPTRIENVLSRVERVRLGSWDARGLGLGGWTLDVHHFYDPVGRVLYLGDGSRRSVGSTGQVITTVAGSGVPGYCGDDSLATNACVNGPNGVAVGPDGSIYIADTFNNMIRRVTPNGVISRFAGTGAAAYGGDGGSALDAALNSPVRVAVAEDGTVYIADALNHRVRRVDTAGVITTVAGNGTPTGGGDGQPATTAGLNRPYGLVLSPDGSLYIADALNHRVRRVAPDGIIRTVVGTGTAGFNGDSLPPRQTQLNIPAGIALTLDGSLYIAEYGGNRVRLMRPDGKISTVVPPEFPVPVPIDLALGRDGSLYIAHANLPIVRRLSPQGVVTTLAGRPGEYFFSGEGGPPGQATLGQPLGVAMAPSGALVIADAGSGGRRIVQVSPALPGFDAGDQLVFAENGAEAYRFSAEGRHLATLDALTGAERWSFQYDSTGQLSGVTDAFDNQTVVERDASGMLTVLVAPLGQRTGLGMDSAGYLAGITNPAGETVALAYAPGGLLDTLVDARGNAHVFSYDSLGLLERDADPAGGSIQVSRAGVADGFEVTQVTALGRTTRYRIETDTLGRAVRTNTSPAGLVSRTVIGADGSVTSTSPDSTVTAVVQGPDPRAGMQAGILKALTTRLPSGLTSTVTGSRSDSLANPADPLSLVWQVDTLRVNGRAFVNALSAAQRTFASTTPEGRTSGGELDSLGRVIAEVVPGVDTVKYSYDVLGRLAQTVQGSRTWRYTYDTRGRLDSVIDPLLRATTFGYDSAGRVAQQTLPDGRIVGYGYDNNGNLTQVTPPGRAAHAFTYSPVDLTATYNPPTVAEGATPTGYEYNLDRQLARILRPDGDTVRFSYDTAGRPETVVHGDGPLNYSYLGTGNLGAVVTPAESLGFAYDGSLLRGVTWSGAVSGSVTASYDTDFRVSGLTVNGTPLATFGYDGDGLLTQAGDLVIHRSALNGRIDSTLLGAVTTSESYDRFGQWSTRTTRAGATELYRAEYARDSLGRISELLEVVEGDSTVSGYEYDDAGRLKVVRTNGVVTATYEYDDNGNRLSVTRPSGMESGTYDAQDRLLAYGTATYAYTKAGDLRFKAELGDTTWYRYDALGNLLEVNLPDGTDIEYVVDGFGRRVGKKINGVLVQGFLYQGQVSPVAELDGAGNMISRFVYGTRANVPDYVINGGVTYRIVTDHLGSVRLVVSTADGMVVQRLAYDEFGRELGNTNPGFQPYGYAGGLTDPQTELLRFGARDYDPETGRWTAKDPIKFGGGTGSLYLYVGDAPVNGVDPSGLWAGIDDLIFTLGGALVGVGGQLLGDLFSGELSGWENYLAAAIGGAVGGEALLYAGPVAAGVLGAVAGNLSRQGLRGLSGEQCGFDLLGLGAEGLVGALTGFVPGAGVRGLNAGTNSWNAIFKQMVTKFERGRISRVELSTALKMFAGQGFENLPGAGAGVAAGLGTAQLLPSSGGCPCQ